GVHVGWERGVSPGWEKGKANFVIGNRCIDNGKAGVLLEYATENVIRSNSFQGGKGIVEGKDAAGNYIVDKAGGIPRERLKLLDEFLRLDAKNMQEWAPVKKTLRAPR